MSADPAQYDVARARPGFSCAVSFKELVPSLNCLAFLAQKAVDASTEQSPQPLTHPPGGSCRNSGVGWE